jgi:hypothetical protein
VYVDASLSLEGPPKRWPGEQLAAKQKILKSWLVDAPDADELLQMLNMHRDFQPGVEYTLASEKRGRHKGHAVPKGA